MYINVGLSSSGLVIERLSGFRMLRRTCEIQDICALKYFWGGGKKIWNISLLVSQIKKENIEKELQVPGNDEPLFYHRGLWDDVC